MSDTRCSFKTLLFCQDLLGSIDNFEFSLKNFDDDVVVISATCMPRSMPMGFWRNGSKVLGGEYMLANLAN